MYGTCIFMLNLCYLVVHIVRVDIIIVITCSAINGKLLINEIPRLSYNVTLLIK